MYQRALFASRLMSLARTCTADQQGRRDSLPLEAAGAQAQSCSASAKAGFSGAHEAPAAATRCHAAAATAAAETAHGRAKRGAGGHAEAMIGNGQQDVGIYDWMDSLGR